MSTVRIQLRRGTEQEWIDADAIGLGVVLAPGEAGIETDTNRFKFGNGNDKWGELLYANASNTGNTLDDYLLASKRGNPDGVASLDSNGLVPVAQLPASVKVTVSSVADQAARLALTAEPGDIAIQTDSGASYVLQTAGASTNANWKELVGNEKVQDVIGAMLSGNTETGITVTYEDSDGTIDFVVADQFSTHSTTDLSEGTNLYFTDARAVTALSTEVLNINNELDLKATIDSPSFSGIPTADTAAPGTNNTQIATTAYADAAIAALVDTAPGALNTLNEIAAAINDDATFSGTIVGLVSTLENDFLGHSGSPSAHGSQGDLVGLQNTQTLTNKTISGASNTLSNIPQSAITDLDTTLDLLAPKASPAFTGTVTGITKAMVDLSNVDNTSDVNKPISTPTQNALDLKADATDIEVLATKESPTFSGTVILPTTTSIGDTTALEIAKLHDITATAVELNTLDGITASTAELNILDGVTATFSELNVLDGIISTTAELNILNGVTATAAELNTLDGVLATAAEINHLSGVTSAIQTQLNAKANSADITEAAQDAVGDVVGYGLVYDDATGKIQPNLETAGGLKFAPTTNKLAADLDYIVDKTGVQTLTNKTLTSPKINEDVALTATATELNVLNGITATTAELNVLDGVLADASEINILEGAGVTTIELNYLMGSTSNIQDQIDTKQPIITNVTDTEIGYLDGVTSSIQTQLNGKQATVANVSDTEIGYLDGVTSGIQGQLDAKLNTADASTTNISEGTNLYFTEERAQDAIGTILGTGLTYNDSVPGIGIDNAALSTFLLDGSSGNSYGLIGTSAYLDVKNTNGYNKEIELDIAAVKSTLDTDGYITTASTSTLTNKTLTSPKINEDVALSATSTELNVLDGITASTAELNILYGVTATSSEINILDGATLTVTELNYVDGVTSAIQTQLNSKADLSGATFTGSVVLNGDPSAALHAATKQYVDNTASGVVAKPQVLAATSTNIVGTYSNGTAGVGATITHNSNGAWPETVAGATGWAIGKGILLKNQTNKAENGRYYVSNMGSASTPWVLTRCGYCDEANEIPGAYIFVQGGTLAGTGWVQTVADPTTFTVGTDDINVYQFSGSGTITAGTNISVTGNEVSTITNPVFDSATIGDVSNTELQYLNGVTSAIQTQIDGKQSVVSGVSSTEIGYLDGVTSAIQTQLDTKESRVYTFVTDATTARTVTASTDEGKTLRFTSSSPITITIPTAANDAGWAVGDYVEIIQYGSGQITVAGDTGVTVNATDSQKKTRVQFSSLTLIKVAANEWLLTGDTTA
jgi:hypothetical protein